MAPIDEEKSGAPNLFFSAGALRRLKDRKEGKGTTTLAQFQLIEWKVGIAWRDDGDAGSREGQNREDGSAW